MTKTARYPQTKKLGIRVINVKSSLEGINVCKDILQNKLSNNSILFLSGGSTPKNLYELLSKEEKLEIAAVALVDERFGKKMHDNSNEKMIKDSGFFKYLKNKQIPVFKILENKSIIKTSKDYEKKISTLLLTKKNKVALLGIGADGHTAGIPAVSKIYKKIIADKSSLVAFYDDKGKYSKRITITFNALEKLDEIIVLVFGKEKQKALSQMFKKGSIEQIPVRFLIKNEIANKVTLITDQKI